MLSWVLPALVLAANPYLEEGRRLYAGMHYLDAEAKLRLAKDVPTSTVDERRAAYELLARCLTAQGKLDEAQGTFQEMLAQDPAAPAPAHAAPKILEAFRKAKEHLYPPGYVQLKPVPAAAGWLELELLDPWEQVDHLELFDVTRAGPPQELHLALEGHRATAQLPAAPGGERKVYLEARASDGRAVAHLGSATQPLVAAVEVAPGEPEAKPAPPVVAAPPPPRPSPLARFHLYGAGLVHLATLTSPPVTGGAEVGASYGLTPRLELGLAVVPGRRTGAQLEATLHPLPARLVPFVQARVSVTPLETGVAPGGGLWVGGALQLGPGRVLAGVAGMLYLLPASAASTYRPATVLALAGYELDLGAL